VNEETDVKIQTLIQKGHCDLYDVTITAYHVLLTEIT